MNILPEAPTSLWLDTYGPYTPESPLNEDLTVDIAIIGGGFTGLATAYELKRSEPALRIVVLEAQTVGYGASGRNGSFAMTVVGLGIGTTAMLRGKQFLKDAHAYMERAVDCTDELIQREDLDCDRIQPGFLRVATTMGYIKRLQHDIDLIQSLGFEGITWIDQEKTRNMVNSERYLGALWEPRLVLVNPLKMVREEKRVILEEGVQVFENSPVLEVVRDTKLRLKTPNGTVKTEKLVFATNAYSHLFPELRRKQIPAFTYMVATDPLTEEQLAPIGWEGQQGVEDARNLIHYYRLTPERRLVMGGGPVGLTYANDLAKDTDEAAWKHLEEHIHFLFPSLKKVALSYRWGGPFSVTIDLAPAMGYLGDVNVVYSLGCIGHGVAPTHLNGQTLADLLLERQTDLTSVWFVERKPVNWPPEPLRWVASQVILGYLHAEDWWYERNKKVVA